MLMPALPHKAPLPRDKALVAGVPGDTPARLPTRQRHAA